MDPAGKEDVRRVLAALLDFGFADLDHAEDDFTAPGYRVRDRDEIYDDEVRAALACMGIAETVISRGHHGRTGIASGWLGR